MQQLKLTVLILCVSTFIAITYFFVPTWSTRYNAAHQAPEISLLPDTLAGASKQTHWRNQLEGSVVENGAVYGPISGTRVTLDFFRGRNRAHNGIACLVTRGDTVTKKETFTLNTASGQATFTVAFLQSVNKIHVVASTQCSASECGPNRLNPANKSPGLEFHKHSKKPRLTSIVPVSIIITPADNADGKQNTKEHLKQVLIHTVASLNLRPARHLAAAQQGMQDRQWKKLAEKSS